MEPLPPDKGPAQTFQGRILTMQIISGAMGLGASFALGILTFIRILNPPPPRDPSIVSYIVLAVAAVQLVLSMVLPDRVAAAAAPGDWYAVYQTRLIVRLALFEGAALALAVAWFLEWWPVTLIACLVFIALLYLRFPSAGRVERWVEAQKELAYQDRAPS